MTLDWKLIAMLAVALVLTQPACWLLARGLGLRLERRAIAGGLLAPFLLLAPWLSAERLLVPCNILSQGVPGAPAVGAGERSHDLLNDTVYQLLPWELEIRHALAERRLPLWSDTLEGGSSPWANPQAGPLSPIAMVARAFPIQHHLLAALALKILIAFEGTWLLARLAGRSRRSALLAAAGFSLGGGIAAWALFPITATAAWAPWVAAGAVRLFRRPGGRVIVTSAALTAAMLLSGHPETAAAGGLFAAACGLCLRRRAAGFRRGFAAAALAAALGFGLAAPHILPFLKLIPDSQRADESLAHTMPEYRLIPSSPASWFLPGFASFVLAPTNPHAYGRPYRDPFRGPFNWADSEPGYTGLLAFAGALAALLAARDRRARPFLGFAAVSLLLAAQFVPIAHLLYAVPPLRVPAYARFLPVGSLALAIAGAFGTDLLFSWSRFGRRWAMWGGLALAAAISLAVAVDPWVLGLWALLAGAALLAAWKPRWGAAALGLVLVLDLVPWSRSFLPVGHPALFYPRTELMEILVREAGDPAQWRATAGDFILYPSLIPVYGVAEVRPHNPLVPASQLRVLSAAFGFAPSKGNYFAALRNLDHPLLDFLGAEVVATSIGEPPARDFVPLDGGRFAPYFVFRNPQALPRWFLPAAVDVVDRDRLEDWIAGLRDGRRVAVFRDETGSPPPATRGFATVRALATRPGSIALALPPGGETLLATSIPLSAGWKARSGGRPLRVVTVNGAFLGVLVPAGVDRVELGFLPAGFVTGCAAFGLSALASLALLLYGPSRPASASMPRATTSGGAAVKHSRT